MVIRKIIVAILLLFTLTSCTNSKYYINSQQDDIPGEQSQVVEVQVSTTAAIEDTSSTESTTTNTVVLPEPTTQLEEPEPTQTTTPEPEPDDSQLVLPDDSYEGIWISKGSGSISIISVDPNFVKFKLQVGRGPHIEGTAVRQDNIFIFNEDVSPDLVYTVYDIPAHDGSSPRGHLEFRPDSVALIFDEVFDYCDVIIGDTRLTEPEPVIPNQKYIGKWAVKTEIKGEVIEVEGYYLSIRAVEADKVIFGYSEYKGLELETVAIKKGDKYVFGKDISPYMEFDHYIISNLEKCSEITGSLVFYDDSIAIIMSEFGRTSTLRFNTKHETGTSPKELPEDAGKIIDDTIAILEEKGWSSIKRIKIEPDGLERWGVEIPPYDPEYNTVIYNLLGSCNGVDVVVRIVYDEASELWKTVEAFYASESGKVLRSEELEKFMKDHGKTDFILPPDDTDLVEYFK